MRIHIRVLVSVVVTASSACSGSVGDPAPPSILTGERIQLSSRQISALDSAVQVITKANPTNGTLRSLADSTLLVLTAGIEARQLPVTTTITSAPLYFVGIHRVVNRPGGSFSTWALVGFDNPEKLENVVEVSGFAQNSTGTAPAAVSGTIGDGTGVVNGLLLDVEAGGAVTQWNGAVGSVSFSSGSAGVPCPGFVATAKVSCAIEQMNVKFTMEGRALALSSIRTATLASETEVPTMRLTYTP